MKPILKWVKIMNIHNEKMPHNKHHAMFLTFQISAKSLLREIDANGTSRIFDSRILARHKNALKRIKIVFSLI